jgi:hypothetical protein
MKHILTALFIAISMWAFSQPMSKKGEPYLPEAGNWAIGVDAVPFLNYFGNMLSQNGNEAPGADFMNSQFAVTGKYFLSDQLAVRASARLGILADNQKAIVPEFSTAPTNTTVEDVYRRTFTNAYLSAGIERRRGNTRIQGFYGVEGVLGFGTEKHVFEYGNSINPQNTNPVRAEFLLDFQNLDREVTNIDPLGAFTTEFKLGTSFMLGARAFAGAEIFLFPKWSVGFEFGLGALFRYTGNSTIIAEQWTVPPGGSAEQFVTLVSDIGGSSSFVLDTDRARGALFMFFYF